MRGPEIGALRHLVREAKDVLSTQVEIAQTLSDKAATTFRFGGLLLGLLVTGLTISRSASGLGTPPPRLLAALWTGAAAIVLSVLAALAAFRTTRVGVGLGLESVVAALEYEADEREVLAASLGSYGHAAQGNARSVARTAWFLQTSLLLLALGILLLAAGAAGLIME